MAVVMFLVVYNVLWIMRGNNRARKRHDQAAMLLSQRSRRFLIDEAKESTQREMIEEDRELGNIDVEDVLQNDQDGDT